MSTSEVHLTRTACRRVVAALREWSDQTRAAVAYEVELLTDELPRTAAGLTTVRERTAALRARFADSTQTQRRLVSLTAAQAVEDHADACGDRWRPTTRTVLDELVPRRTSRDTWFPVLSSDGVLVAGFTCDTDLLVWATETGAPADAHTAPLAQVAGAELARQTWRGGTGGTVTADDGTVVASYP